MNWDYMLEPEPPPNCFCDPREMEHCEFCCKCEMHEREPRLREED